MHRVHIIKEPLSMYLNVIRLSMMLRLMSYLFQENRSYGVETICIHPLMLCHCTSPRRIWHRYSMHSGQWSLCSRQWALDSGQSTVDSGQSIVGSGQWAVDSGRWTVGIGNWTVDRGKWTVGSE